jgi:hypothetical protein
MLVPVSGGCGVSHTNRIGRWDGSHPYSAPQQLFDFRQGQARTWPNSVGSDDQRA